MWRGERGAMNKSQSGSKAGIPRRAGQRSAKIKVYYKVRYPFNKLCRILRHNGPLAARDWAQKHKAEGVLLRVKKAVRGNHD